MRATRLGGWVGPWLAASLLLGAAGCGDVSPTEAPGTITPGATTPEETAPSETTSPTAGPQTDTPGQGPTETLIPPTLAATPSLDPDERFCEDVPVLTWQNFGQGFTIESCQSCHATTTADRHGAPPGVTFDTYEQTMIWRERILARATGDEPTMPPGGGVSADDRYKLEVWLRCWEG